MNSHEIQDVVKSLSDGDRYKLLTAHIKPKTFGKTYQVCDLLYYTYVSKVSKRFQLLNSASLAFL